MRHLQGHRVAMVAECVLADRQSGSTMSKTGVRDKQKRECSHLNTGTAHDLYLVEPEEQDTECAVPPLFPLW